jgi:hypothetical protein
MVDPLTLEKCKVLGEKEVAKQLFELVDPNNLEKRFGGNLPDKKANYFPPELI